MKTVLMKIFIIALLIAPFTGCAILGSDVQAMRNIKVAHVRSFDKSLSACYELTAKALTKWGAVIAQSHRNDYIVAMEFEKVFRPCINTTELGIFFTETGPDKTEMKVTSANYNLSEFIAPYLFNYIAKDGNLPAGEELKPAAVVSAGKIFKKQ